MVGEFVESREAADEAACKAVELVDDDPAALAAPNAPHDPVEDRPVHRRAGHILLRIMHHQLDATIGAPALDCLALQVRAGVALTAAIPHSADPYIAVDRELEITERWKRFRTMDHDETLGNDCRVPTA